MTELRGCGMIDCVNQCGGEDTWATCPHAKIARLTAALRKIAYLRPAGPTRNKLVEQMERIALDTLEEQHAQDQRTDPAGSSR